MSIPLFLMMYLKALSIRPPLQPSLPSGPVHDNRTAYSFVDIQTCIEQLLLTQSLCSGTCPYLQTQQSGPRALVPTPSPNCTLPYPCMCKVQEETYMWREEGLNCHRNSRVNTTP